MKMIGKGFGSGPLTGIDFCFALKVLAEKNGQGELGRAQSFAAGLKFRDLGGFGKFHFQLPDSLIHARDLFFNSPLQTQEQRPSQGV